MSIYFTRSITGSIKCNSLSLCIIHRRFSAHQKSINHYDALGVNASATTQEIKKAFYDLSKKLHPDVNPNDKNASEKFSTISNAYDVLSDPVKRRDYDGELSLRVSPSDPFVTYDRTSVYSQRARAHRPSAWKPPPSSKNSSGGFPGAENAFGSSRGAEYGTFDKEYYDGVFGRYRGPTPTGRSRTYNFDEHYRAHYETFKFWGTKRRQAQERMRQEYHQAEQRRQEKAARSTLSKLSSFTLWLSCTIAIMFAATRLHDVHFHEPADELRAKFFIIQKSPKTKRPNEETSTKS